MTANTTAVRASAGTLTENANVTPLCRSFSSASSTSLESSTPSASPAASAMRAVMSVSQNKITPMWRFSMPRIL